MRAGAFGLTLLSDPLDTHILLALEPGQLELMELRRALGSPPQTTLRKHLRQFCDLGVLTRIQEDGFPGTVAYELGPAGSDLLDAAKVLAAWLATSPDGPLAFGGVAAKSAVRAVVGGWSSNIVRALAARPLSLTELDRLISGINYPALERRLAAMRVAGQIEPVRSHAVGTPYKATRWLRQAIGPLVTAADWECRWASERADRLGRLDVEATFLLAIPLVELPETISGSCRLAVELSTGNERLDAGVIVTIEGGRPISFRSRLGDGVQSSATGSARAWLGALVGREASDLDLSGDHAIAKALLAGLRASLTGANRHTRKPDERHLREESGSEQGFPLTPGAVRSPVLD